MDPGTRLGPYEIVEPLGRGGMGEVYRARDARLGRDVAVKTISAAVALHPERRARFEREARLLAALNHPNVGAIYGVEETNGAPALVLELVEGDTLHERLHSAGTSRPMPVSEAIAIARQIADALEAAHDKGIVHRDLKPANVKVTPAGVVKVLDFGLGRLTGPSGSPDSTSDPTITSGGTLAGAVLGTAAYMSPEQSRGSVVDRRTDVWAFGCVLFEMLTGARAFAGETVSDTLVQVITRDPDWASLPAGAPPALVRLLRRCLRKDQRRRLRDIGDARLELEEIGEEPDERPSVAAARPAPEVRLLRLTDSVGISAAPAVSPDGKMVAFVAAVEGRRQIFVRLLAGGAPLQLTRDAADHDAPRWTADSSALVYHVPNPETGGHLFRISALGGQPRRLAPALGGADVSHDGRRIAFFQRAAEGSALVVSPLDGGGARVLIAIPPQFAGDCPRWSPDDRLVAFQRGTVMFDNRLETVDVASMETRTVVRAGWLRGHSWLGDGSALVYSSSIGSTMAYPPTNGLRLVGRDGAGGRQLTFGDASYLEPDVDAAGRTFASRAHLRSDVWSFPVDGDPRDNVAAATRVTRQAGQVQVPCVSPDGSEIVYVSDNGGHSNLWIAAIDGSACQQITFESDPGISIGLPLWEPGGERIAFVRAQAAAPGVVPGIDIGIVARDGGAVETLVPDALSPCWSADGRSLYLSRASLYLSREAGHIQRFDLESGAITTVRAEHAIGPAMSRAGGPLFFARVPELLFAPGGETEICCALPEDGEARVIARLRSARVPLAPRILLHTTASPDGRWLAAPLQDGATVNVWLVPTDGSPMRPATDFGDRPVFIARHVSWSPDSRRVYAAVADSSADIVLLEGLLG